jgi:hypothetical protein
MKTLVFFVICFGVDCQPNIVTNNFAKLFVATLTVGYLNGSSLKKNLIVTLDKSRPLIFPGSQLFKAARKVSKIAEVNLK